MDKNQEDKISELLSTYQAPSPRADYKERFWVKLVGQHKPKSNPLFMFKWGVALSCVAMFIFGVGIFEKIRLDGQLSKLSTDQVQMIAQVEVVENLDVLQDFITIKNIEEIELIEDSEMV